MEYLTIGLGVFVVILIINIIVTRSKDNNKPQVTDNEIKEDVPEDEKFPYVLNQSVLTNKEQKFYQCLKPITDKYNLTVLCKMRIADIVHVPGNVYNNIKWFNYIKAKHIDFTVCDSDFAVKFLIEVDDSTHDRQKRQERDDFVNRIFGQVGVKLLRFRTWTTESLESEIMEAIGVKKEDLPQQEKTEANTLK